MRKRAAIVLNLLIPGTGMIVAWREWLGAAPAILYGFCWNWYFGDV